MALLSILGSLAYGVSPVDLIPDLIPLLGFADDAVIAPVLFGLGAVMLYRRMKARSKVAAAPTGDVIDVPARTA